MKVGLVIYGPLATVSGGYLYDRMLVQHLRSRGDQVEVISLGPTPYVRGLLGRQFPGVDESVDVLLQDELCHPSLLRFNRRAHLQPIIGIVHNLRSERTGMRSLFYRFFERQYLFSVDAYIFNSQTTRSAVSRLAPAGRPQLVAFPGGDRLGEASEVGVKTRATEPGPLRLVFLANVIRDKGLQVLLQALRMMRAASCCLDVVGSCSVEPGYARRMQRLATKSGSEVRFHGNVDGSALGEILKRSHAIVIPSYYEGFGIAYLEGMAHGLAALGTTAGAARELIEDGVQGFLVEPGDARALADRISSLALDRRLLARMASAALAKYQSSPRWQDSMEGIRDFLLSLARPASTSGAKAHDEQA